MNADHGKVLVIDDEAGLRRSLRFGLSQRGWAMDEVEEGLPALKLIERSYAAGAPYQCVVADICLPDINGLKLVEIIKSSFPALPIVVVSAYGNQGTEDDVRGRHGDAFLPKPFMVDELTRVMGGLPQSKARPAPVAGKKAEVSQTAYVLVRLADDAEMMAAFQKLYFMDGAVYCDAVHGPYHVVMLMTGESHEEIRKAVDEKVLAVPGVVEALFCPIIPPRVDPTVRDFIDHYEQGRAVDPATEKSARGRKALNTYVFVDIEPGRFSEVLPRLYFLPGVVSCDPCEGRHDAVLLFQTASFSENERVLTEELKRIEGIARTRSAKVVHLLEM
ncbi:MAG TPA: response regulator [Myxococcales bacterium]|jgi:CheY-like chemotaxis protein